MTAAAPTLDVSGLVDLDVGIAYRSLFDSAEILQEELARVFTRSWLFLAPASQLRRPGDFVTGLMGRDHVLVTRDEAGELHAMLNVCRHRGMRVCRADLGTTTRFTCSYHGWSYDTRGTLVEVPMEAEGYEHALDRSGWGLVSVTRVETRHGLVFGCWDPEAPDLDEYLAGPNRFLGAVFGDDVELAGPMRWRLRGNWKLAAEQFSTDSYHPQTAHASALTVLSQGGSARTVGGTGTGTGTEADASSFVPQHGRGLSTRYGHGWSMPLPPPGHAGAPGEYAGADPLSRVLHANVFPNLSVLGSGALRVWHPRGVDDMEIWSWTAVPAGASQAERRQAIQATSLGFSTTGILETDDSENWSEIQAVGGGFVTGATPLNYQMGLLSEASSDPAAPGFEGRVGHLFNDVGARGFYRRWLELMTAEPPRLRQLHPAPVTPNRPAATEVSA